MIETKDLILRQGSADAYGFTYSHSEEAELLKNGEKVILDYYIYTF